MAPFIRTQKHVLFPRKEKKGKNIKTYHNLNYIKLLNYFSINLNPHGLEASPLRDSWWVYHPCLLPCIAKPL